MKIENKNNKDTVFRRLFSDRKRLLELYNGTAPLPDQFEYRLSDLFFKETANPSLELKATVLNVNEGHNKELMESCKTLNEYSIFVSKVRKYTQEAKSMHTAKEYQSNKKDLIKEAVTRAIDECISENILKDFFTSNREEAIDMSTLECTAEEYYQVVADENYDKGLSQGILGAVNLLRSMGINDETIIQKIMAEYNLSRDEARKYL